MTTLVVAAGDLADHRVTITKAQVLVGAVLVQLILGTVYGYSIFWQPLEAEFWPPVFMPEQAAVVTGEDAQFAAGAVIVADAGMAAREREHRLGVLKYSFAICLLSFAASMVLAGRLQDLKGPRFTAILGGTMLGLGFFLAGQMNSLAVYYLCHAVLMGAAVVALLAVFQFLTRGLDRSRLPILQIIPFGIVTVVVVGGIALGQQYISNSTNNKILLLWGTVGFLAGVGTGFAYVCPIAALVKWFPRHKGLVSGIAVAGFGLGAYVFSGKTRIGGVGYIETHGITTFFGVHGLLAASVVCAGALLLRNPPSEATQSVGRGGVTSKDSTWQELFRGGRFYLLWTMFFSGALAGLMVIGILKPFAGSQLVHAAEARYGAVDESIRGLLLLKGATAVGVLALFNAAGRVVWGWVSDRIGRSVSMTLMFTLQGITLLCLTALDSEWTLAIGAGCVGFNFGGNFALFPSLTADLFGAKNFGVNYGWVFTSYGVAGVLGVWAGNTAQQLTGSYFAAFAVAAAFCFVSAGLSLTLRRSRAAGIVLSPK